MTDFSIRVSVFLAVLTVLLWWQWRKPAKILPRQQTGLRWRHNLLLFGSGILVVRLFQPLLLSFVSLYGHSGLLSHPELPFWAAMVMSLILLDGVIYWQHRLFHTLPWLWRLHRVHHSDPSLDTSSALRFHPVEILLSLGIKSGVILLLGIPFEAVLLFDIVLNASAMFNHTNVRIPEPFETWLRRLIVTPDYHRIHHSRSIQEANSNYGFCLSLWDRIFASYTPHPHRGEAELSTGMPQTRHYAPATLNSLLMMPFWSKRQENMVFRGTSARCNR
ncbi:sterol desaturase family protein [Vibrio quintilis]|uniref:Fatty acid hydroxylase superfamily protein n=1 Tax=Vibrio quintilis TaxID=1117707 RepID=A0A1M7YQ43_9VIBR|nr:sterol desaturase family protein [Vibrio quintilis]SHO54761.1 Fatty acid hydroxylase superfamily protein [Vibrio quintilis]